MRKRAGIVSVATANKKRGDGHFKVTRGIFDDDQYSYRRGIWEHV